MMVRNNKVDENYEGPLREKTSKWSQFGWEAKNRYDDILPINLEKYLLAQVGKKWDKIYSRLCRKFTDLFIRYELDHRISYYVVREPIRVDGILCDPEGYPLERSWRWSFYVENGILKLVPRKHTTKYRHDNESARRSRGIYWINNKIFGLIKGIWYELEVKEFDQIVVPYDAFLQSQYSEKRERETLYGSAQRYCESKRQLNSKEIKHLKLYLEEH